MKGTDGDFAVAFHLVGNRKRPNRVVHYSRWVLAMYSIPPEAFGYKNERRFLTTNLCGAALDRVRNEVRFHPRVLASPEKNCY